MVGIKTFTKVAKTLWEKRNDDWEEFADNYLGMPHSLYRNFSERFVDATEEEWWNLNQAKFYRKFETFFYDYVFGVEFLGENIVGLPHSERTWE